MQCYIFQSEFVKAFLLLLGISLSISEAISRFHEWLCVRDIKDVIDITSEGITNEDRRVL